MLCGGSIGLQADTVTLASGMPLEFPAPPSLQILAIARYRCGLRLVWHENPSLLYVPSRRKHYTSNSSSASSFRNPTLAVQLTESLAERCRHLALIGPAAAERHAGNRFLAAAHQ